MSGQVDPVSLLSDVSVEEQVFFRKSGCLVTVVGFAGDKLVVEKIGGKRMIVTRDGIDQLGITTK